MEGAAVVDSIGTDYLLLQVAGCEAFGPAGAYGTAFSFVRRSRSLHPPTVLHAGCLGEEWELRRHVREPESQDVALGIRGPLRRQTKEGIYATSEVAMKAIRLFTMTLEY
jgi:hypothetical protein